MRGTDYTLPTAKAGGADPALQEGPGYCLSNPALCFLIETF